MKKKKLKGMERAYASKDSYRLEQEIPLIQDTTELITPDIASKMLEKNPSNRPISWPKVEQYKKLMLAGKWEFHAQGIILDDKNNILTGQKRLRAIVHSGIPQWFRISRGTPKNLAHLIDRGTPQSSRDLATRITNRKHSPTEGSIARAICALEGNVKPNVDDISDKISEYNEILEIAVEKLYRIKKTKEVLMIIAATCHLYKKDKKYEYLFSHVTEISDAFIKELAPAEPKECWKRGAVFTLGMERALRLCKKTSNK